MLHDVAACHISKRGHCDIDLNFQGQYKSYQWFGAAPFCFKEQCLHILYVYVLGHSRVLYIKMRLL
jgi:hypothetical protein